MSNLARKQWVTYCGGNQPAEQEDTWDRSVRMLYLITITVWDVYGSRSFYVRAANFHNAEAVQQAFDGLGLVEPVFDGAAAVDVTFEPDVLGYLKLYGHSA